MILWRTYPVTCLTAARAMGSTRCAFVFPLSKYGYPEPANGDGGRT